jgi:hypothetical protein
MWVGPRRIVVDLPLPARGAGRFPNYLIQLGKRPSFWCSLFVLAISTIAGLSMMSRAQNQLPAPTHIACLCKNITDYNFNVGNIDDVIDLAVHLRSPRWVCPFILNTTCELWSENCAEFSKMHAFMFGKCFFRAATYQSSPHLNVMLNSRVGLFDYSSHDKDTHQQIILWRPNPVVEFEKNLDTNQIPCHLIPKLLPCLMQK